MNDLPLLALFNRLRDAGLPLGIGEYQLVLKSIQSGFGVADREALARLCSTLWVKSDQEQSIFEYYFDRLIPQDIIISSNSIADVSSLKIVNTEDIPVQEVTRQHQSPRGAKVLILGGILVLLSIGTVFGIIRTRQVSQTPQPTGTVFPSPLPVVPSPSPSPSPSNWEKRILTAFLVATILYIPFLITIFTLDLWLNRRKTKRRIGQLVGDPTKSFSNPSSLVELSQKVGDEVQIASAIRQVSSRSEDVLRLTSDYFPVTRRQMKQSWRYLRRLVREGAATELCIETTINQVAKQGMLLHPVLIPRRVNRTELMLLIDRDGSMVPFHDLSERLTQTAIQGGQLGKADVYYFHNCPVEYLYYDPFHRKAEPIKTILAQYRREQAVVLIFSDAGAARGGLNLERIELAEAFLKQLKEYVRYVVWLNPMPQSRWANTTAEAIARLVPMFEMTRQGLDMAIDVLRGRYQQRT